MDISFVNEDMLTKAYNTLATTTEIYSIASCDYAATKTKLETTVAKAKFDEIVVGKNAEQRDASARANFPQLYEDLEVDEEVMATAKLNMDLSSIEKSRVLSLLRLAEVLTQAEANEHNT